MKNCWTYAMQRLIEEDGWLLTRFTRRSNKHNGHFKWLGTAFLYIGVTLTNWGMALRTGKWLHTYYASRVEGPYYSYEPFKDVHIDNPPFNFKGHVVEKQKLN